MSTKSIFTRHRFGCHRCNCINWFGNVTSVEVTHNHPRSSRICAIREGKNDGEMGHGKINFNLMLKYKILINLINFFVFRVKIQFTNKQHPHSKIQRMQESKE
jgi:hypothetical protein